MQPLIHEDAALNTCMVHAGCRRNGTWAGAAVCARRRKCPASRPGKLFEKLYGDQPDRWDDRLEGAERLRFIVNCFTRLRYVDAGGRLMLRVKGSPKKSQAQR